MYLVEWSASGGRVSTPEPTTRHHDTTEPVHTPATMRIRSGTTQPSHRQDAHGCTLHPGRRPGKGTRHLHRRPRITTRSTDTRRIHNGHKPSMVRYSGPPQNTSLGSAGKKGEPLARSRHVPTDLRATGSTITTLPTCGPRMGPPREPHPRPLHHQP